MIEEKDARLIIPGLLDDIERLRKRVREVEQERNEARAACIAVLHEQARRRTGEEDPIIEAAINDALVAGRDVLSALTKARAALRTLADKMQTIADGDHAWLFMESNVWGDIPADDLASLLTSEDARATIEARAAVDALGIIEPIDPHK